MRNIPKRGCEGYTREEGGGCEGYTREEGGGCEGYTREEGGGVRDLLERRERM